MESPRKSWLCWSISLGSNDIWNLYSKYYIIYTHPQGSKGAKLVKRTKLASIYIYFLYIYIYTHPNPTHVWGASLHTPPADIPPKGFPNALQQLLRRRGSLTPGSRRPSALRRWPTGCWSAIGPTKQRRFGGLGGIRLRWEGRPGSPSSFALEFQGTCSIMFL